MEVIDGTIFDYRGPTYLTLLSLAGVRGMSTYGISDYFEISPERIVKAVGTLHLKGTLIDPKTSRLLKRAKILPANAKNPKFWGLKQVEAIVKQTKHGYGKTRFKKLKTFLQADSEASFEEIGTKSRETNLKALRALYEDARAIQLQPECYKSDDIRKTYPGFLSMVREYSNENREARKLEWTLLVMPMNSMISKTLSNKFGVTTDLKITKKVGTGVSKTKLFDKVVIDKLMGDLGIDKVAG